MDSKFMGSSEGIAQSLPYKGNLFASMTQIARKSSLNCNPIDYGACERMD
jgi:hypothetical protein